MPKYKIGGSMGYVGTDWEDVIEADHIDQAEGIAWDIAIAKIESWAEPLEDEK